MVFGDRFCMSRKGGTGGSGWVHLNSANSMAASQLGCFERQNRGIWYIYGTHEFTVTSIEFNSVANQLKIHPSNYFFLKEPVTHPTNQLVNDTLDCSFK